MTTRHGRRAGTLLVVGALLLSGCLGGDQKSPGDDGRPDRAVEVWAVGDGPTGREPPKAVARLIKKANPRWLLYLGDVYGPYGQLFDETYGRALARRTLPTPGNHDWPSERDGYLAYWQEVTGHTQPTYYARRVGGWQLISLNSEEDSDSNSPQYQWLLKVLADPAPGTCRLAFWHQPRFSAGQHGDAEDMDPIWDAMAGKASVVVSGHDHTMEQMAPEQGITQLVSGAGGRSHYRLDTADSRLQFGDNTHDGALAMQLTTSLLRYRFVAVGGEVLDSGVITCERGG